MKSALRLRLMLMSRSLLAGLSLLTDEMYVELPRSQLQEVLDRWRREVLPVLPPYKHDLWDCDDYATTFKAWFSRYYGNGVGIAFGKDEHGRPHAWNLVLTDEGIVDVEPQLGAVVTGLYKLRWSRW